MEKEKEVISLGTMNVKGDVSIVVREKKPMFLLYNTLNQLIGYVN